MRVLHVLTLITPDGAFGGPARVAVNQCATLSAAGHDVVLAAGVSGFATPPADVDGVAAELFPATRLVPGLGYAATYAPAMRKWLQRNGRGFDVAHVHLARDLVTLPAAARLRRLGVPYVVQTHGMVTPRNDAAAAAIDRVWTLRALRDARAVFHLNDAERSELRGVAGAGLRLERLANGVPVSPTIDDVARATPPEVLFLARLHPRKRPEVFARAALELLRRGVDAQFALVGPAEGAEGAVLAVVDEARAAGFDAGRLRWENAISPQQVTERMRRASVYVLPAVREPFGMTIVEALAEGVPVVINGDGGLADFVTRNGCGAVVDGDAPDFANAIARLLADPEALRRSGRAGRQAVADTYGMDAVARRLDETYRSIVRGVTA